MIVLAALNDHVVILQCDHPGLAFVSSRPGTGPIGLSTSRLVPGERELADLKLSTATEASYVGVIGHAIYEKQRDNMIISYVNQQMLKIINNLNKYLDINHFNKIRA